MTGLFGAVVITRVSSNDSSSVVGLLLSGSAPRSPSSFSSQLERSSISSKLELMTVSVVPLGAADLSGIAVPVS